MQATSDPQSLEKKKIIKNKILTFQGSKLHPQIPNSTSYALNDLPETLFSLITALPWAQETPEDKHFVVVWNSQLQSQQ